ncbi:MAG TPA: hypothetical protein VMK83_08700 [Gaiellaceae bacterium]|nr:hypothetical protein [Gaiellaceae bacterium]
MLRTLLVDVRSTFSRQNVVQNGVSLLVYAAISLVWPTAVRIVRDVSLWYLIPLAIAGFLAAAALALWRSDRARPSQVYLQSETPNVVDPQILALRDYASRGNQLLARLSGSTVYRDYPGAPDYDQQSAEDCLSWRSDLRKHLSKARPEYAPRFNENWIEKQHWRHRMGSIEELIAEMQRDLELLGDLIAELSGR